MEFRYLVTSHFNKNHYVPPHSHNCYELTYYQQAGGVFKFSKTKNTHLEFDFQKKLNTNAPSLHFSEKTFIVIPPNTVHAENNIKNSYIISIGFTLKEHEKALIEEILLKNIADLFNLDSLVEEINSEYCHAKAYSNLIINSFLIQLIVRLARNASTIKNINNSQNLNFLKTYLDEYYMTDIDLDAISTKINYSKSYLRAQFKNKFQISFKQYILQKRLDYAKSELSNSMLSVSIISQNTGFKDYYQFSAFFKKHTGLSPRAYRDKYQKTDSHDKT